MQKGSLNIVMMMRCDKHYAMCFSGSFHSIHMLQITRGVHTGRELLAQRCSKLVDSVIRVDHAGELGANQIYRGQMAILGKRLK